MARNRQFCVIRTLEVRPVPARTGAGRAPHSYALSARRPRVAVNRARPAGAPPSPHPRFGPRRGPAPTSGPARRERCGAPDGSPRPVSCRSAGMPERPATEQYLFDERLAMVDALYAFTAETLRDVALPLVMWALLHSSPAFEGLRGTRNGRHRCGPRGTP